MKKLLLIIAVAFSFTMCNQPTEKIDQMKVKNDSIQRESNRKDSALYALINTFNAIESNLNDIKEKEKIISLTATNVEDPKSREEKINEDIQIIYNKMNENKEKVRQLEKKLRNANIRVKELQATINNLKQKLIEKDAEIVRLNNELKSLNIKVADLSYEIDSLAFDNAAKQAVIEAQDVSLNKGYYIIGTNKELKDMGVLDKTGIYIGSKKLNSNFDKALFTEIDIRENTSFKLGSKKAKLVTSHPESSYELIGEKPVESINITNPQEFWSVSKFLVIVLQ